MGRGANTENCSAKSPGRHQGNGGMGSRDEKEKTGKSKEWISSALERVRKKQESVSHSVGALSEEWLERLWWRSSSAADSAVSLEYYMIALQGVC